MGSYQEEKNALLSIVEQFKDQVLIHIPDSVQLQPYKDLLEDIRSDFYTIVVLGEFKRGKSTFINALLGEALLPVGVTPTTATINALIWGETRSLCVQRTDGSTEYLELSSKSLDNFVAETEFDSDTIKYIKIELPSDILKNQVVLVDTPGIDDLNQHRVDVTYNFVPRADAVIFLLDATSPVRQTEKEFLKDYVLKHGLKRIVFLANFMDQVDDEEKEEVIESANRRLAMALESNEKQVLPISAFQALQAKLRGDGELLNESGLLKVEGVLQDIIREGSQVQEKLLRFKLRFEQILDASSRDLSTLISIQDADYSQLSQQLLKIEDVLNQGEKRRQIMQDYIQDREQEMLLITRKSIRFFGESMIEEISTIFDDYSGQDFKKFIEKEVPNYIRKRLLAWVDQYSGPINKMFDMLKRELALGLAREFNTTVNVIESRNENILIEMDKITIKAEDILSSDVIAGLIAGGVGTIILLAGAPLWPLIGMAGLPWLRNKIAEYQLEEAKTKIRTEFHQTLDSVLNNFQSSIEEHFQSTLTGIGKAAEDRFGELLEILRKRIQKEIAERTAQQDNVDEKRAALKTALQSIEDLHGKVINQTIIL